MNIERSRNIVTTVINHNHLVLKITNVLFKGLTWLHLDGEEVFVVLKLLSRGVLIEKISLTSSKFQRDRDGRE